MFTFKLFISVSVDFVDFVGFIELAAAILSIKTSISSFEKEEK